MSWGTNPSVSGDAIRKALGPIEPEGKSKQQTALDEADLRELERAEYYEETPATPDAGPDQGPNEADLPRSAPPPLVGRGNPYIQTTDPTDDGSVSR